MEQLPYMYSLLALGVVAQAGQDKQQMALMPMLADLGAEAHTVREYSQQASSDQRQQSLLEQVLEVGLELLGRWLPMQTMGETVEYHI
jgi:hypothetical protein